MLALGLALRDIMRQQVQEEGEDSGMPEWVVNSKLTMTDLDLILNCPQPTDLR